ncbi:hypothetical protein BCR44DRAFT_379477 [Catenaria anguillulae PL171]|uniref:Uncharacterized protein n=1 Tax=Catenaria anguillulae PL171 TaxID=765915 RepID=A0A1Y2HV58_9FUNG|nr:hypothetical protein BCR44DRAFT_379477 [Catenaria anguillulae PL171]
MAGTRTRQGLEMSEFLVAPLSLARASNSVSRRLRSGSRTRTTNFLFRRQCFLLNGLTSAVVEVSVRPRLAGLSRSHPFSICTSGVCVVAIRRQGYVHSTATYSPRPM